MKITIMTLFPEMCNAVLDESIIGRARKSGIIEIDTVNIRDFTLDKHNRVDDAPYGGGMGMLMQTQPIYDCFASLCSEDGKKPHLIYMSAQGKTLTQKRVKELSQLPNIAILCGHYEGVDERIIEEIVDEEISVGDYVLTGGELPALILSDSIARMIDGVLPNDEAKELESHYSGLLEYPQYTRPPEWHGRKVPDILLSGHHGNIDKWRREKSLERTLERRPDMLKSAELTKKDREYLALAIHDHMVTPSRSEGMGHAEAAAGGVDTSDVNPRTLESRKQPGLYFAGEVLDVTGLLGGYNLHWAWASGKAVGESWKK